MESYIVQLDFSAAFDRVSHSGLSFKLKSFGVVGSVMSICTEFLSDDHRQRVVVDGAASQCIKIISVVAQGSVSGPLLFILYTREMFELVENRLFAICRCLHTTGIVRKLADRDAVAGSLTGT